LLADARAAGEELIPRLKQAALRHDRETARKTADA
jgi:hypothetical protein